MLNRFQLVVSGSSAAIDEEFSCGFGQQEAIEFRHLSQAVQVRLDVEFSQVPAKAHVLDPQIKWRHAVMVKLPQKVPVSVPGR